MTLLFRSGDCLFRLRAAEIVGSAAHVVYLGDFEGGECDLPFFHWQRGFCQSGIVVMLEGSDRFEQADIDFRLQLLRQAGNSFVRLGSKVRNSSRLVKPLDDQEK